MELHGVVALTDGTTVTVNIGGDEGDPKLVITDLLPHLGQDCLLYTSPCVVKAPTGGSSLGVYLPKDRAELADALRQGRSFCHEVLVEQRIYGRELTDAVRGERYLPPVETFPSVENFDYEAKYCLLYTSRCV